MNNNRAQPESPFRLNLEQQRKRAKELRRDFDAGDSSALRRFGLHHPGATQMAKACLSDAQLVIARELGTPSWPKLKAHIEAMRRARDGIAFAGNAPDAAFPTLHIRCGSDLKSTLSEAGFVGDFLEY